MVYTDSFHVCIVKSSRRAYLHAGRIGAMHTGTMTEEPLHATLAVRHLLESHNQIGVRLEIRGILICSRISRLLRFQLIPLFAGQLTAAAAGTF